MRSNLSVRALTAAFLFIVGSVSVAAPLLPGGSTMVNSTTAAVEPELAGTVVNDNILDIPVTHIPGPGSIFFVDFNIQNRVTESSSDGTLIFGPQILWTHNVTGSFFLVDSISLFGFGDFATDVAYRTDGPGDRGPTFAERSVSGEILTFDFGFPIAVSNLFAEIHENSYFLSINTDATAFDNIGRASIFGRSLDYPDQVFRFDYEGLAVPTTASVPSPAPVLLILAGVGLTFVLGRNKRS